MGIGVLWYDDKKKELSEQVARAVEYYQAKYGAAPTLCFVNPLMLKQAELMNSVQVRPAREAAAPVVGQAAPRKKKMNVNA